MLDVSAVPIWYWKPRSFLESCWSQVLCENLETLILTLAKESGATMRVQINLVVRGKTVADLFCLVCYQKVPPTANRSTPLKAIRPALQGAYPCLGISHFWQVFIKTNHSNWKGWMCLGMGGFIYWV